MLVQLKLQVIDGLEDGAPELDGLARPKDATTTKLLPQLNRHYNASDRAWRKHYTFAKKYKMNHRQPGNSRSRRLRKPPKAALRDHRSGPTKRP